MALLAVVTIAFGTLIIAILEQATEIPYASAVYLVALVVVGSIGGTVPAVITAVASFLVYPRATRSLLSRPTPACTDSPHGTG